MQCELKYSKAEKQLIKAELLQRIQTAELYNQGRNTLFR